MFTAQVTTDIEPFHVMELLRRAKELERQGLDVVHMEIGEPDFETPPVVTEAAKAALEQGDIKYTQAAGLLALREAIAGHYQNRHGLKVDSRRIFVTPGASGALLLALAAAMPRDGRVLVTDPGYPCYRNFIRVLGGEPVAVDIGAAGFELTADQIDEAWRGNPAVQRKPAGGWAGAICPPNDLGKQPDSLGNAALMPKLPLTAEQIGDPCGSCACGLVFASPSNPTGSVMDEQDLAQVVAAVDSRGGFCISDEIYHGLEYDGFCQTALAFSPRAFVINSFSKYFGMTGWRLGWAVVPEAYCEVAERLCQNLFISAPTLSQLAAIASFEPNNLQELERRRLMFRERRDFLHGELRRLGFKIPASPSGAFYLYADSTAFSADSFEFCHRLLEQAHVAITPGKDFGSIRAERFVRFAYTSPLDRLAEGIERIERFLTG
jgi:aspartate/methionine/tyrosine aminotransferase